MKILVIGGGAAGYFTALRYKNFFKEYKVDLIQSKNINIIGVGESSLIDIPNFFLEDCDININDFHNEVTKTFKLGLQTRDWAYKGKITNYTFDIISSINNNGLNVIENINNKKYTFFSNLISHKLPPITKKEQLLVTNINNIPHIHAYQIENKKFIPFLKKQAEIKGIIEIDGEIKKIKHNENEIKKVFFNEKWHTYDFYIDCSGFNGCITKFIKNEWISFKDNIPCDSALVGEHEIKENPNQCTIAHAMTNGWMFQIDTEKRTGKGYIYNSSTINDDEVIKEYTEKNENKIKQYRKIKFNSGFYKNIFNKNYCLIGNSAGFAEPLESTGYSVIINTINLLIKNHKDKKQNLFLTESEMKCNNLFIENFWKEIINIIILHYKFNNNYNNEFWNYCKNLKFYGDFNEVIKYLLENNFSLEKSREININYLNNILFPVEYVFLLLNAKNIIKKKKLINNDYIIYFKNKINNIMPYQKAIKEKNYKKYYDNKISINDFLNY